MADRKVFVVAPTMREVRDFAMREGFTSLAEAIAVLPANYHCVMRGSRGIPHVILRWDGFDPIAREEIREQLLRAESPPYGDMPREPEDDDDGDWVRGAGAVRPPVLG